MKKLALGIVGVIALVVIYYFTLGTSQLTTKLKEQVTLNVKDIQTQGFKLEEHKSLKSSEHIVLSIEDPKKVAIYLASKDILLKVSDIKELKGFKFGIDIAYLANTYSAVSIDIYPINLPTELKSTIDKKEKKLIAQFQEMLDKKALLVHIDINKLGNSFKGYLKDINETIKDVNSITLEIASLKFTGNLKNSTLKSIKETLKNIKLYSNDNKFNIVLNDINGNYIKTGPTKYDYTTKYKIRNIVYKLANKLNIAIKDISGNTISKVKNSLIYANAKEKIANIIFTNKQKTSLLEDIEIDMKIDNFDIKSIDKLNTIDPNNEKELLSVLQEVISHGVSMDIENLSVKNITLEDKKLNGFKLRSQIAIDKSLNISSANKNPMQALSYINANLKLLLSNELFTLIAQQPQATMMLMLFKPKDINNQKVYDLKLKDAKATVNGIPIN